MTHEYLTLNGKVVYEKIGTGNTAKIMVFTYDAQGRPFAVKYSKDNGASFTNYFYALNLQGDVVKIFRPNAVKDANETIIGYTERTYATYSYNAWGELTGITDSNGNSILNKQTTSTALANLNPLRYRGYYYDNETGFYYLQSRYYDPANHRFLNADIFTSTDSTDAISCNMFAYCENSPIFSCDPSGKWTFGISISASAFLIFGASVSIGVFVDGNGDIDCQWSYAVPTVNETKALGIASVGVCATAQFTNRDSVQDLLGHTTAIGGGVGCVGFDFLGFSPINADDATIDGLQISAGAGAGLDVHITDTYSSNFESGSVSNTSHYCVKNRGSIISRNRELVLGHLDLQ